MLKRASPFRTHSARHGFTLTEVLVAVGVLLAIVLVTGRIFKITTDVTAAGEATIDIMQEAAAIEKRIRSDIATMTHNGFLVIHGVGVPNSINIQTWEDSGQIGPKPPLLNPTLAFDATIRCDQLAFFREGADSAQGWNDFASGGNLPAYPNAQALHSMIYYGHGIQLPELGPFIPPGAGAPVGLGHDPYDTNGDGRLSPRELTPWRYDNPALDESQWLQTIDTDYSSGVGSIFSQQTPSSNTHPQYVNATQPDARQWILARQQVLLADDDKDFPGDQSKRQYLQNVPSAMSIFPHDARLDGSNSIGDANIDPPLLAYGRVDLAACPLDEVRELLRVSRDYADPTGNSLRRCAHPYDAYSQQDADPDEDGILDMELRDINEPVSMFGDPSLPNNTYLDQRFFMKDVVTWPRVERTPPSNEKPDQILAYNMLGSACSSFIVEWTWIEGAGEATVPSRSSWETDFWPGIHYESGDPLLQQAQGGDPAWVTQAWHGQRWFGMRDIERGVMSYEEFAANFPAIEPLDHIDSYGQFFWNHLDFTFAPFAVDAYAVDREPPVFGGGTPYEEYWATFGFNQENPDLPIVEQVNPRSFRYKPDSSFAPWPTALRITMTIHDPRGVLEQGHVYQFVVPLPVQALGSHRGGG